MPLTALLSCEQTPMPSVFRIQPGTKGRHIYLCCLPTCHPIAAHTVPGQCHQPRPLQASWGWVLAGAPKRTHCDTRHPFSSDAVEGIHMPAAPIPASYCLGLVTSMRGHPGFQNNQKLPAQPGFAQGGREPGPVLLRPREEPGLLACPVILLSVPTSSGPFSWGRFSHSP